MMVTVSDVVASDAFETVRARNGWSRLHLEGKEFYDYLEAQEQEIGALMRDLGFLRN